MTPERYQRITQVLRKRQPDLTVVTDEIHKYRNVAAIVRTCDAVGISSIHCVIPRSGYQLNSGAAAGTEKWVQLEHYSDVKAPICKLKKEGFQILAAHLGDDSVDYREIDYTLPTALVMGAELDGVSEFTRSQADHKIIVPMMGMVESFNVSVACGLILAEAQSQRSKAGHYDLQKLAPSDFERLFFQWAHPKLRLFCDKNNIPYPAVDEEGEVINLPQWYASVR